MRGPDVKYVSTVTVPCAGYRVSKAMIVHNASYLADGAIYLGKNPGAVRKIL